jgi:hypothetical protein
VVLYALACDSETIEPFLTREEAEAALKAVLADEPEWAGRIKVVELVLETAQNYPGAFRLAALPQLGAGDSALCNRHRAKRQYCTT